MPAELTLVPSAIALALSTLLTFPPGGPRAPVRVSTVLVVLGVVVPLALHPLVDPLRATGRALWQWSAVGGPTIQASYDIDPLAAVALALTVAFTGAATATAGRVERRHPAVAALTLAIGLVTIALVVTDDLVAAIVVLAVLAVLTVLALLAVAPPAATARAAGYLAMGLQAWVVAALLISRQGSAGFSLGEMVPGAVTGGAVLAATAGALLFAGLYPAVAWSFTEAYDTNDPGPLGSLLLMPAGIGATVLLVRLIGVSRLATTAIPLPDVGTEARLAIVVLILLAVAVSVATSGRVPARTIAVGIVLVLATAALPVLGWAHVVLIAAILTATYAAVVALAVPEHWETVRPDLALVAIWLGIASGVPLAIAGGVVALFARAGSALAAALSLDPHRDYIALVGGSAAFVVAALAVGAGAAGASDPVIAGASLAGVAVLVVVELSQVGRRFRVADVPRTLDVASALAALLLALLASIVLIPLEATVRAGVDGAATLTSVHLLAFAAAATFAVTLARVVRPLLPYFELFAERSEPLMRALDPVPVAVGAFRAVETAATRGSSVFALFEQRAGVWLATVLIVGLLVWAAR